jgi:hypothetical protein
MADKPNVIGTKQAAAMLDCTERTVRALCKDAFLPYTPIRPKLWVIERSAVVAFARRNGRRGKP